ncbi:MAG: ABC transporter permease [Polyangiales bacterium]
MHNTLTIAKRQFRSYFNGPVAYIVISIVLLALGVLFWTRFFLFGRASVRLMFQLLPIFMLLAAPAMTMGLLAEEKRTGTIELLITMPVRDAEVILGKFLGVFALFGTLLLLTLPYPISVSMLGKLDWGPVGAGYLGLLLQGGAMLALGLLASSWTENQLIALFTGVALCLLFTFVIQWVLPVLPGAAASVLEWLSLNYHLESMARGVIDSRDLIFFVSLIAFALMFAFRSLESRRWRS